MLAAMRAACADASIDPSAIGLVSANGPKTGTV